MKEYSVAQYAKKLKVSRFVVYRMIKGKSLPPGATAKVFITHIYIEVDER